MTEKNNPFTRSAIQINLTGIFRPDSTRSYKIGVVGNNWLVGWLVGWVITQFSQKRL